MKATTALTKGADRSIESIPPMLSGYPNLNFVHGKGVDTVNEIVLQLRERNLVSFHGIIDRDRGNQPPDGVHVISRYCLENYLYDPLCVYALLRRSKKESLAEGLGSTEVWELRYLSDENLQTIVDSIFSQIEGKYSFYPAVQGGWEEVTFVNGKKLKYPHWFLHKPKKDLKLCLQDVFGQPQLKNDKAIKSYRELNMIPSELLRIYEDMLE